MKKQPKATHAEATAEVYDTKRTRVRLVPKVPWCPHCNGHAPIPAWHSAKCPLATVEDLRREVDRARQDEQRARDRAEVWLTAVRQMHGKLSTLKHEIKQLRAKLK